jgi:hypothetical protein
MSSITPVDLSTQVETGLPLSTEAPDKEPVKSVAAIFKTQGSRRYVLLAVIAVAIGVGTILGLSLGLTQGGSSTGTSASEASSAGFPGTILGLSLGLTQGGSSTGTAASEASAGFPVVYGGCLKAKTVVVDGSTIYGKASFALSEDVPVCGQNQVQSSGTWFTVTAEEDGTLMALFIGFHQFAGENDFVSLFEGDCSEELTCFDGTYEFDGLYGYYKWNAVAGVEYKVAANADWLFGLKVVTL